VTDNSLDELPKGRVQALLERIAPGSLLLKIELLPGSFSNHTCLVEARSANGNPYKIVVRRYKIFGDYDRGEKARREFKTFELLSRYQVPAPEPLLLDESGDILGSPGIVTRFVEGALLMDVPSNPVVWAQKLARTLARIHCIPCRKDEQEFLLKGNDQAAWFLKYDAPPHYMQAYPGGADLWHMIHELSTNFHADSPSLLHIDYWSGNILWHNNEISAVLDWEEAAYGDPAVDVAYARMNMVLMGAPEAADEFMRFYESEMGRKINNLGFWELAASVRPMVDPVDWKVTETTGLTTHIFLKFIDDAKKRVNQYKKFHRL
jgi:aminoglycoside phosphotransferase (APT) family kinase protein